MYVKLALKGRKSEDNSSGTNNQSYYYLSFIFLIQYIFERSLFIYSLAYQEEIIMLKCDNKPSIYLWLQITGDTLGVNNLLFGFIHVSLPSKTIKSNTQNLWLSPLMLENSLPFIGEYFGWCKCVVTGGWSKLSYCSTSSH